MGRRRLSEGLDASAKKRLVRLVESGVSVTEAGKHFGVGYDYALDVVQEFRNEVASRAEQVRVRRTEV